MVATLTPPKALLQVMKPKLNEQEQKVEDALVDMGVNYTVAYLGERTDDSDWQHDEWLFQFVAHVVRGAK